MPEKKKTSKHNNAEERKENPSDEVQNENLTSDNQEMDESEAANAVKGIETLFERVVSLSGELDVANTVAAKEKARADDMKNLADRLQADFDNYRKRTNESNKRLKDEVIAEVIEKFLPVLDTLNHGASVIKDANAAQGVKMIAKRFAETLSSVGVEEIEALGAQFDPNLHNAVMQEPAQNEGEVNTVSEVFTSGYKLGDKVIRHSMVKVKN